MVSLESRHTYTAVNRQRSSRSRNNIEKYAWNKRVVRHFSSSVSFRFIRFVCLSLFGCCCCCCCHCHLIVIVDLMERYSRGTIWLIRQSNIEWDKLHINTQPAKEDMIENCFQDLPLPLNAILRVVLNLIYLSGEKAQLLKSFVVNLAAERLTLSPSSKMLSPILRFSAHWHRAF